MNFWTGIIVGMIAGKTLGVLVCKIIRSIRRFVMRRQGWREMDWTGYRVKLSDLGKNSGLKPTYIENQPCGIRDYIWSILEACTKNGRAKILARPRSRLNFAQSSERNSCGDRILKRK